MIHVLAAHGAESGDDSAGGTLSLGGSSSRIGPVDRLGHFDPGILAPLGDGSDVAAFADGLVDGCAGPPLQPAQHGALRAIGIVHRAAARTAGSAGHPLLVSELTIPAQADTVEPCFIEEFPSLHVKADGDKAALTHGVGSRPSAAASAEVPRDTLTGNANGRAVVIPVPIAVAIMIPVLRRRQRSERDEKKNSEDENDFRHSLPRFARSKALTAV